MAATSNNNVCVTCSRLGLYLNHIATVATTYSATTRQFLHVMPSQAQEGIEVLGWVCANAAAGMMPQFACDPQGSSELFDQPRRGGVYACLAS